MKIWPVVSANARLKLIVHNDFQDISLFDAETTPLEALNDVLGAAVGTNPTDVESGCNEMLSALAATER